MCGFFDSKDKETTQKTTPDELTQRIRMALIPYAMQMMNQSFPGYAGDRRVEPFTDDQRSGFGMVRNYTNAPTPYYDFAQQTARSYANAPQSTVNYTSIDYDPMRTDGGTRISYDDINYGGRIVDESGPLGKVSDYMNPYVQGVVQPQIRELGEARRQAAIQAGEQATSAGAFGDARQGVADSLTNKAYMNAVGDVTGRGYSDAFNQAMAARTGDIGRLQQTRQFNAANNMAAQQFNAANELQARQFNAANEFAARQFNAGNLFQASQLNAQLREAMLGRQLAGGQAGMEYGLQQSQDRLQRLNAMMNVGQLQQQRGQQIRDADYENYLRGVEWPFRQWDMMLSMLTGQPNAQTVSQTQRGGNDLWGFLGTILGTAAGSAARGGFGA